MNERLVQKEVLVCPSAVYCPCKLSAADWLWIAAVNRDLHSGLGQQGAGQKAFLTAAIHSQSAADSL